MATFWGVSGILWMLKVLGKVVCDVDLGEGAVSRQADGLDGIQRGLAGKEGTKFGEGTAGRKRTVATGCRVVGMMVRGFSLGE